MSSNGIRDRFGLGWSDVRGMYMPTESYFVYRKEMHQWHTFLPKAHQRYQIMQGDQLIAKDMTSDEADAMLKLLEASK